jgi:hypothetical protein
MVAETLRELVGSRSKFNGELSTGNFWCGEKGKELRGVEGKPSTALRFGRDDKSGERAFLWSVDADTEFCFWRLV